MRRVLLALLCLFLCISLCLTIGAAPRGSICPVEKKSLTVASATGGTLDPLPTTSAASWAVFDPTSQRFLAQGNADERRPMASTTKIMTALVVLEHCSPDEVVTVDPRAVGIEGSSIYLYKGEQITVKDLLYGLLLSSANDAATALAIHTAGSEEAFVALMNKKATALGLRDTHFCNPHGLHHEAHYTTARELAILTAAALEDARFAEIVATRRYAAPQQGTNATRLFLNHNRLLGRVDGVIGVKTGYTKASGRCLVSAIRHEGLTLIAVTLDDPDDWRDHTALLEWGVANYVTFSPEPQCVTLPVVGGKAQSVELTPAGELTLTLPADHGDITCTVEAPRFLYAGFSAGTQVGRLLYHADGQLLGELALVTKSGIDPLPAPSLWGKIKNFFTK